MRDVIDEIRKWKAQGKPVAVATTIKASGSPMRPLGSKMAVTPDQQIAGSVTGGCIEGAVYEEAQEVIRSGKPKLLHYGVSSEQTPWDIGLSCGSSLDVLVESLQTPAWQQIWQPLEKAIEVNQLVACATLLDGKNAGAKLLIWPEGKTLGTLGSGNLDQAAVNAAHEQMVTHDPKAVALDQEHEVFIEVFMPSARLVIIGAVHLAIPLAKLGKVLGYTTIVLDPRKAFATRERFAEVDQLIVEWPSEALVKLRPDAATFVAAVTHDEKIDNPALAVALKSEAAYVGVLGTKRNVPKRLEELLELGVSEEQLKKLHAPIGLDIGAVQTEEIALSVLADMVAVRHGRSKDQASQPKSVL